MKKTTRLFIPVVVGLLGAFCYCGTVFAQPTISNIYPNGTNMFQPSPTLTFTATSGSGITNIVVDLTATNLYTGAVILAHRTSTSGVTVVGTNASTALSSNTLYGVTITAYDAGGSTSVAEGFDTINPVYTWEAEDWDYTNGLYFDTGVNQYAGLSGTAEVDYHGSPGGGAAYRPKGLETENPNGDHPLRLQYIGTTNRDYNVGFTSGGDWANYTHHYPAGTYIMFVRSAGGNGPRTESADISVASGTATTTNVAPLKFGTKGTGWGNYDFMPVTDAGGNLAHFTFDGSQTTLRETQVQASDNFGFFMLMPVPVIVPSTVTITNVTPDGSVQFQASNSLSFVVSSPVAIDLSSVGVQLTTKTLFGSNSTALLSIGSGLSYTGNSTNITVTAPLTTNVLYSALILANDANGVQQSFSVSFDTIIPAFTFEAEDWNYGGGHWITNSGPDAYAGSAYDGVAEIDYHRPSGGTLGSYGRVGLQTEGASDIRRAAYITPTTTNSDYDVGFTTSGDWADYTRSFPAGVYNLFVRVARGNGGTVTDAGKISLVTSDPTVSGQTIQDLGKHNTPSTGGWQNYVWVPILNSAGFPARLVGNGGAQTLRYTFDNAGDNINFILLLPATGPNPPPYVSSFYPDNLSLFQFTNLLTFVVSSSVGIATNGVTLNLDGANVTGLSFGGTPTALTVTYPVSTNAYHKAIVTSTDSAGTTFFTNIFTTYYMSNYQWEAEDFDYNSGQHFDNQYDAYNGLSAVSGVDYFESDANSINGSHVYRPAPNASTLIIPTGTGDLSGELPRYQFTSGGGTAIDYNIGFFGPNSWANYTRQYPAGTYNVVLRTAEGNNPTEDILYMVTSGVGTTNQTTAMLGTFYIPVSSWTSWRWVPMVDSFGKAAQIDLDGSVKTLRLGGSLLGHDEANVNFLMLVPTVAVASPITLQAARNGGNIVISFPTRTVFHYQVLYKNNLTDPTWTPLGSPITGNGAVQSVSDPTAGNSQRFYRVQIQ